METTFGGCFDKAEEMERQSESDMASGFSHRMCRLRGAIARIMGAWVSSRVHMKTPVIGMYPGSGPALSACFRRWISYETQSCQSLKDWSSFGCPALPHM